MEIALNTYSLRKEIEAGVLGDSVQAIINLCKDTGITKVEYLDHHFDMKDLPTIIKRLKAEGIEVYSLGAHCKILVNPKDIQKKADEAKEWLQLAHDNNIKYVRFQMDSGPFPKLFPPMEDFDDEEWEEYYEIIDAGIEHTKSSYDLVVPIAEKLGVTIGIETHGSFSSNWVFMKKFNEIYTSKNVEWVYDIGNYENDEMRFKALEEIKKRTAYLHAKSYKYDDKGFEVSSKKVDFPRATKMLKEAGFDGVWSIEFEGKAMGIRGFLQSIEWCKYSFAQADGKEYTMKTDFPSDEELIAKYKG
jgi:sugar phosphate isomerase/epimerase